MPRVKIDYVVSFSSEDPEHPASNLLSREVSKKKWLCNKGESSCSVVLQLNKAVQISGVHIGVHHAALVEVLVARSETSTDQFQVLVASSVFVSPRESRGPDVQRVRSFSGTQLSPDVSALKWDRVRVVCSQPYNKHCKYGLSFIHIDEAEGPTSNPVVAPSLQQLMSQSSDEEDFKPGELFAKHLLKKNSPDDAPASGSTSTGAQIRQATSQALKNLPDSSTKLTKTPINKPQRRESFTSDTKLDRTRDNILYTDDDQKPHNKIDNIVNKHKDEKEKEKHAKEEKYKNEKEKETHSKQDNSKDQTHNKQKDDKQKHTKQDKTESKDRYKDGSRSKDETSGKRKAESDTSLRQNDKHETKRRRADTDSDTESSEPHTILQGCELVLSGYVNPQRAHIRQAALAMGAKVGRDWGPTATHLVCAFPNTPKLREVRKSRGSSVPVVLAAWVLQCSHRRRKLPWRPFATEPEYRRPENNEPKQPQRRRNNDTEKKRESTNVRQKTPDDTECDTDDEIEKVLQKQKRRTEDPKMDTAESDGGSTDEGPQEQRAPKFGGALPDFFDGHTFAIDAPQDDAEQLARYVKAYGGVVVDASECDEEVEYVVAGGGGGVTSRARHVVSARWLADCHNAAKLLPPT